MLAKKQRGTTQKKSYLEPSSQCAVQGVQVNNHLILKDSAKAGLKSDFLQIYSFDPKSAEHARIY